MTRVSHGAAAPPALSPRRADRDLVASFRVYIDRPGQGPRALADRHRRLRTTGQAGPKLRPRIRFGRMAGRMAGAHRLCSQLHKQGNKV